MFRIKMSYQEAEGTVGVQGVSWQLCWSSAAFSLAGKCESMTGIIKSMEESPLKRDESECDCGEAE